MQGHWEICWISTISELYLSRKQNMLEMSRTRMPQKHLPADKMLLPYSLLLKSHHCAPGTPGFVLCLRLGTLRNPLLPLPAAWWFKCSTFSGESNWPNMSKNHQKPTIAKAVWRNPRDLWLVNLAIWIIQTISSANNRLLWVLSADALIVFDCKIVRSPYKSTWSPIITLYTLLPTSVNYQRITIINHHS